MRYIRTAFADNRRWDGFESRPDDIFVCAPPKCGTTWIQTIIVSLLWPAGDAPGPVMRLSPWVEERGRPAAEMHAMLNAQRHRRILKSHMPADGIPWHSDAKYLFVGRDGRDAFMSWCNHVQRIRELKTVNEWATSESTSAVSPFEGDFHAYFRAWISEPDNFLDTVATYWARRESSNLMLIHFNDLKSDLGGEIERIRAFLGIRVPRRSWPAIIERCTFDGMRSRSREIGNLKARFVGGMQGFLYKGENGRWRDVLNNRDLDLYQHHVSTTLTSEAAAWLERGREAGAILS